MELVILFVEKYFDALVATEEKVAVVLNVIHKQFQGFLTFLHRQSCLFYV